MPQTPTELLAHLEEQLAFIDASCEAFDRGVEFECKRLAIHVRVLVHDTHRSTSLLTHLGVRDRLWFHDPVAAKRERIARNLAAGGVPLFMGGLVTVELGAESSRFRARSLGSGAATDGSTMALVEDWWRLPALFPTTGPNASRKDVMHWLAHKDGGGHIDDLPPTYVALTRGGAMGATYDLPPGAPPARNSPIPAAMRQIAEELRRSIREQAELVQVTAAAL